MAQLRQGARATSPSSAEATARIQEDLYDALELMGIPFNAFPDDLPQPINVRLLGAFLRGGAGRDWLVMDTTIAASSRSSC